MILGITWIISLIISAWSERRADREIGYITLKDPTHREMLFTIEEMNTLEKKYPELDISYSYESTATIQANNRECLIWLVQTNENYRKWNKLSIRQGGFLQNNSYNNKQIVIDNKVAFSLFGNTEGQDINVEIAGDTYVVKGVTKQTIYDEYKCKKQNVVGNAYYMRIGNDILLNGFIVCNLSDEKLKNQETADLLLITLGRNKEDYVYISVSEYAQRLIHSMKFIRLSIMIMLLIILWKELIEEGKKWSSEIKSELRIKYRNEYLRDNSHVVLKRICIITVMLIISGLVGSYFTKEIFAVFTPVKNVLLHIEEYPTPIRLICRSSQIGVFFCSIVVIFLIENILKRQR